MTDSLDESVSVYVRSDLASEILIPSTELITLKDYSKDLFSLVKDYSRDKKFRNGKSISELLAFDEEFYPWYVLRNPLFKSGILAFNEYRFLNSIMKNDHESQKLVFTNFDLASCFKAGNFRFIKSSSKSQFKTEKWKYLMVLFGRVILSLFKPFKTNKIWLLNSNLTRQDIFDLKTETKVFGDPFLGYLEDEISVNPDFLSVLILKNPGAYRLPKFLHAVLPYNNIRQYAYFERQLISALSITGFLKATRYSKRIVHDLDNIQKEVSGFDQYIISRIKGYVPILKLTVWRYILSKAMIEKYKPLALGGDDEFTLLKYPMFMAAKKLQIPTFAIQHGGISRNNLNYTFNAEDIRHDPLPNKTMVWGEMTANQLIQHSIYSHDQIDIVGQLRTDAIPQLMAKRNRNLSDSKTIVFASQPLPHDQHTRYRMLHDFFKLIKDFKEHNLVWKPHPNEKKDIPSILKLAEEEGCKLVVSEDDLYMLLSSSDAVITGYSTVGSEAVYFGLDLIVLDYSGADNAGYIAEGVGYHCSNYLEMKKAISSVISGEALCNSSKKHTYTQKRAYIIDGNVRSRIVTSITSLIKPLREN